MPGHGFVVAGRPPEERTPAGDGGRGGVGKKDLFASWQVSQPQLLCVTGGGGGSGSGQYLEPVQESDIGVDRCLRAVADLLPVGAIGALRFERDALPLIDQRIFRVSPVLRFSSTTSPGLLPADEVTQGQALSA